VTAMRQIDDFLQDQESRRIRDLGLGKLLDRPHPSTRRDASYVTQTWSYMGRPEPERTQRPDGLPPWFSLREELRAKLARIDALPKVTGAEITAAGFKASWT